MSDFENFPRDVVGHLGSIHAPLRWLGINDPRIQAITLEAVDRRGQDQKEEWGHLDPRARSFSVPRAQTIALVTAKCLGNAMNGVDVPIEANASAIGGGSVSIKIGGGINLAAILGDSVMEHGLVASKPKQNGPWAGLALPIPSTPDTPGFGLSCFAHELTAATQPSGPGSWDGGFEIFVQGLNRETTEALSRLGL